MLEHTEIQCFRSIIKFSRFMYVPIETRAYPQKVKSVGHFLPYLYYLFSPRPCARLQAQSHVTILDLSSRRMDSLQWYQNPLLTDQDTQKFDVGSFR